jgi:hypothetical protein
MNMLLAQLLAAIGTCPAVETFTERGGKSQHPRLKDKLTSKSNYYVVCVFHEMMATSKSGQNKCFVEATVL